jgi:branched-chain amino acid transport system substrate-binding protein
MAGSVLGTCVLVVGIVVAVQNLGGTTTDCDTSRGTLTLGAIVPLSDELSGVGLGMRNAADLAVAQANAACAVPGYRLQLSALDEFSAAPDLGTAVTELAAEPSLVGVIGTFGSGVQPILDGRGVVMVSPADRDPSLTRGTGAAPSRPFATYFRTAATDADATRFAARYLVQKAGKKRLAVTDDGMEYRVGQADLFAEEARRLGATVLRPEVAEHVTGAMRDAIQSADPDAAFHGGSARITGLISDLLGEAGVNVPLMRCDDVPDTEYIAAGGRSGDLVTVAGAPAEALPTAARFAADYRSARYAEPPGALGVTAFDAANVVIAAVAAAVRDTAWTTDVRAAVVRNVQTTNLPGAAGPVAFNQYGDATDKVLTVYMVQDGGFVPVVGSTGTIES